VSALYLLVAMVAASRLAELAYAARNTKRLLSQGAVEIGRAHYPLFFLLHGSWLLALVLTSDPDRPVSPFFLAAFLVIEAGRVWVLVSLGRYFTTRIITLPGASLVRRGPYRFVSHPNYLVVIGEIATLPLAFGNWPVALVWSLLNFALLRYRIALENEALQPRRAL
jgi:methyltransferase